MTAETDSTGSAITPRKALTIAFGVIFAVAMLWVCLRGIMGDSPWHAQDLRDCTRVEIEFQPSTLEYLDFFVKNPGLLSQAEREYLQSLKTNSLTDRRLIMSMAGVLSRLSYSVSAAGRPDKQAYIKVRGYRDDACVVSFDMYDSKLLVTDDGRTFELHMLLDLSSCVMELNSFRLRRGCARRLLAFAEWLNCAHPGAPRDVTPSEWCETLSPIAVPRVRHAPPIEELAKEQLRERERAGEYRCPSAGEGRCHYAMNPDCEPNSPPDTVLMFEANAGWNQHGGPELFTFNHHSPRGGCVLLNDGTVKFIRTEEELKQLRWK